MMKTTQLLITGIAISLAGSLTAAAQEGPGKGRKGKGPQGPRHDAVVKKFDKDGDGKLSEEEREEARKAMQAKRKEAHAKMIEKFDKDGDGKLNEEERKQAHEAMKAQRKEIHEAVLGQFDANGNGKLDPDEREGVREWVRENYPDAIHPPRRGKGGHGKGGPGKGGPGKGGPRGDAPPRD